MCEGTASNLRSIILEKDIEIARLKEQLSKKQSGDVESAHRPIQAEKLDTPFIGPDAKDGEDIQLTWYFETSKWTLLKQRVPWLVGLLLLQSFASTIMSQFHPIFEKHLVIALFVPMLVGTGGNAGNQSSVLLTRSVAGELHRDTAKKVLVAETQLSVLTALTLGGVGAFRVYIEHPDNIMSAVVIGTALVVIILISVLLGSALPLLLKFLKQDPTWSAAPFLTTVSDLLGITVLCAVSALLLN